MKSNKKKIVTAEEWRLQEAKKLLANLMSAIRKGEVVIESVGEWGNNRMNGEKTTRIIWRPK